MSVLLKSYTQQLHDRHHSQYIARLHMYRFQMLQAQLDIEFSVLRNIYYSDNLSIIVITYVK